MEESDDKLMERFTPFFLKYLDLDKTSNLIKLMIYRLLMALFLTSNMAHPDEYWQVTQVAYKIVYPDANVVLPWEFHKDYELRNLIYPLLHTLPLYFLKFTGLDTNLAVRNAPYLLHFVLVFISDYFLWIIGKKTVGKEAT